MATNTNNANPDVFNYTCDVSRATDKDGKKLDTQPLTLRMDFSGVTRSQLITEATRNIVVKLQGKMRGATTRKDKPLTWKAAVAQYNNVHIKVADVLSQSRSRLTPVEKAKKLAKGAEGLDEAAKRALIAELTKSLKS